MTKPKEAEDTSAIVVHAIAIGYYGGQIRNPGDRFGIKKIADFSTKWMSSDDRRVRYLLKGE